MTDHTWDGLHSSTNDYQLAKYRGLITGISFSEKSAAISSQIHFRMLLRLVGILTSGSMVTGYCDPLDHWPDPNMS